MKRLCAFILVVMLMTGMGAVTALASDPPYNGAVQGVIISDDEGFISGSLDGQYELTISGRFTSDFVDQKATFAGTVEGDIEGEVAGTVCVNGLDSLYGVITVEGMSDTVRIVGAFVQTGVKGAFEGRIITGDEPAPVTGIDIQSESATLAVGSTMQMTAVTDPASYNGGVLWGVWVDQKENGYIDQNGVLHALKAGTVTVIANTLDPSLATQTKQITIVDPETEVEAAIDPAYTIMIPASVDFGTLVKGASENTLATQDFEVTASDVVIEANARINVKVQSDFIMKDAFNTPLKYSLSNGSAVSNGGLFASFTGTGEQGGEISVDTFDITNAGTYKGIMTFLISYDLS